MEDIEVNTPSVETSEPAERDLAEREPAERETIEDTPDAEAPEEIIAEQLLMVEDAAEPDTERARLRAIIEAVVFVTDEPLTLQQLAAALNHPIDKVQGILDELIADYNRPERGLTIREVAGGYKMSTRPEHHEAVRTFVGNLKPPLKLSLAALETLAVVAYKQPVTAPEIMEIRGVQGAGVLKTLLDRKLIAAAGRKNVVGKPILYKTTRDFLIQFGLSDLAELPTLKEFEELGRMALSEVEPESASPHSAEPEAAGDTAGPASVPPVEEPVPVEPATEEAPAAEPAPAEPVPDDATTVEIALPKAVTSETTPAESVTTEATAVETTMPDATATETMPPEAATPEATTIDAATPEAATAEATTAEEG